MTPEQIRRVKMVRRYMRSRVFLRSRQISNSRREAASVIRTSQANASPPTA